MPPVDGRVVVSLGSSIVKTVGSLIETTGWPGQQGDTMPPLHTLAHRSVSLVLAKTAWRREYEQYAGEPPAYDWAMQPQIVGDLVVRVVQRVQAVPGFPPALRLAGEPKALQRLLFFTYEEYSR